MLPSSPPGFGVVFVPPPVVGVLVVLPSGFGRPPPLFGRVVSPPVPGMRSPGIVRGLLTSLVSAHSSYIPHAIMPRPTTPTPIRIGTASGGAARLATSAAPAHP